MKLNKYESDCEYAAIESLLSSCDFCGESTDDDRLTHDDFALSDDCDIKDAKLICCDCINSLGRNERTFNQRKRGS